VVGELTPVAGEGLWAKVVGVVFVVFTWLSPEGASSLPILTISVEIQRLTSRRRSQFLTSVGFDDGIFGVGDVVACLVVSHVVALSCCVLYVGHYSLLSACVKPAPHQNTPMPKFYRNILYGFGIQLALVIVVSRWYVRSYVKAPPPFAVSPYAISTYVNLMKFTRKTRIALDRWCGWRAGLGSTQPHLVVTPHLNTGVFVVAHVVVLVNH